MSVKKSVTDKFQIILLSKIKATDLCTPLKRTYLGLKKHLESVSSTKMEMDALENYAEILSSY